MTWKLDKRWFPLYTLDYSVNYGSYVETPKFKLKIISIPRKKQKFNNDKKNMPKVLLSYVIIGSYALSFQFYDEHKFAPIYGQN